MAGMKRSILIVGASFAGLATAFWMTRNGYQVTVIEAAPFLRMGGTPVNIRGNTVDVVTRMGLLDAVIENQVVTDVVEVWSAAGLVDRSVTSLPRSQGEIEYEIDRDVLTR